MEVIPLAIVTSCAGNYGQYLGDWARSIVAQDGYRPAEVCLFTHGEEENRMAGESAEALLVAAGLTVHRRHGPRVDFGTARNNAVALSSAPWVMHLDCDDTLMPHALGVVHDMMPDADVISFGYERSGDLRAGPSNRTRVYKDGDGLAVLAHAAPCSGVSPFRRTFWEQSPYRTDMDGAWDTALWIGFCRLGARFRATKQPCFWYRQHRDSVFNKRRTTFDDIHHRTVAQLKQLRREAARPLRGEVAIIVPREADHPLPIRARRWADVKARYETLHGDWPIVEGMAPGGRQWCKAVAIDDALTRTTADVLVIADADCFVAPDALALAVAKVLDGTAGWAIPHEWVYRLDARASDTALDGAVDVQHARLERPRHRGMAGGGIVVVRREDWNMVAPLIRPFIGWGGEDSSLAHALKALRGSAWRGKAPLIHLQHEIQPTRANSTGNARLNQAIIRAANAGWPALRRLMTKGTDRIGADRPRPTWHVTAVRQAQVA